MVYSIRYPSHIRRATFEKQNKQLCIKIGKELRIIVGKSSMKQYFLVCYVLHFEKICKCNALH